MPTVVKLLYDGVCICKTIVWFNVHCTIHIVMVYYMLCIKTKTSITLFSLADGLSKRPTIIDWKWTKEKIAIKNNNFFFQLKYTWNTPYASVWLCHLNRKNNNSYKSDVMAVCYCICVNWSLSFDNVSLNCDLLFCFYSIFYSSFFLITCPYQSSLAHATLHR